MENQQEMNVTEFDALCTQAFEQRAKIKEMEDALGAEEAKKKAIERQILSLMEHFEKEKHHLKGYGLIYTESRFTVQTPKTLDDKRLLFGHLKERGIFDEMVSVNSQTLNSYYKTEMEAAIGRGDSDYQLPGVGEPNHMKTIKFKKGN